MLVKPLTSCSCMSGKRTGLPMLFMALAVQGQIPSGHSKFFSCSGPTNSMALKIQRRLLRKVKHIPKRRRNHAAQHRVDIDLVVNVDIREAIIDALHQRHDGFVIVRLDLDCLSGVSTFLTSSIEPRHRNSPPTRGKISWLPRLHTARRPAWQSRESPKRL